MRAKNLYLIPIILSCLALLVSSASFTGSVILWGANEDRQHETQNLGDDLVTNSCQGTKQRRTEVRLIVAVVNDNPNDTDVENLRRYYERRLLPSLDRRLDRLPCPGKKSSLPTADRRAIVPPVKFNGPATGLSKGE